MNHRINKAIRYYNKPDSEWKDADILDCWETDDTHETIGALYIHGCPHGAKGATPSMFLSYLREVRPSNVAFSWRKYLGRLYELQNQ